MPPRTVKAPMEKICAVADRHGAGDAVDERGLVEQSQAGVAERLAGHCLGASDDTQRPCRQRTLVGPHHDVGIEHRHQRLEVTVAGGRHERIDHLALAIATSVSGTVGSPCTRRRARLAS